MLGPEVYSLLKDKSIPCSLQEHLHADTLREKGIEHFISLKSDILATLQNFNRLLQAGK
ncbi:MAG: hypothetical protein R2744_07330 [Bacteroidales bacterium]